MSRWQTIILPDEIFMASLIAFPGINFLFFILSGYFLLYERLIFEQLSANITSKFFFEKKFYLSR